METMRRTRLSMLCAAAMLALPACFVPSGAKWRLDLSEDAKYSIGKDKRWGAVSEREFQASFTKGCSVEFLYASQAHPCVDDSDRDTKITVTSATSSDPTVLAVTSAGNRVRVRALRGGSADLTIKAKNRRGVERSGGLNLKAYTPTALRASLTQEGDAKRWGCVNNRKPAELWIEAGKRFTLFYTLIAEDSVLIGPPVAVSASGTSGFTQVSYDEYPYGANGTYLMSKPGTFTVTSAAVPGVGVKVGAFDCQMLTGIAFLPRREDKASREFDLAPMVGDHVVCGSTACPITLTSLTPEVCTSVPRAAPDYGPGVTIARADRKAAGTCRLSAALDGTAHTAAVDFAFK